MRPMETALVAITTAILWACGYELATARGCFAMDRALRISVILPMVLASAWAGWWGL